MGNAAEEARVRLFDDVAAHVRSNYDPHVMSDDCVTKWVDGHQYTVWFSWTALPDDLQERLTDLARQDMAISRERYEIDRRAEVPKAAALDLYDALEEATDELEYRIRTVGDANTVARLREVLGKARGG